jgi:hypothetical protein
MMTLCMHGMPINGINLNDSNLKRLTRGMPMSKEMLALVVTFMVAGAMGSAAAADLSSEKQHARARPDQYTACGPCGCLQVGYVLHRELRSTYGAGFDPRNFDQTEPYYYFGRMRSYPRYLPPEWPSRCWLT